MALVPLYLRGLLSFGTFTTPFGRLYDHAPLLQLVQEFAEGASTIKQQCCHGGKGAEQR